MPMVRRQVTPWRVAKRCVMFLTTLCVIPVLLVLLVITDQYSRPFGPRNFYQHQEVKLSNDTWKMRKALDEVNMTAVGERMDQRKRHLTQACHRLGLDVPANDSWHRPNAWEFLINRQYKLVWCNIFKAASTSWMYNFNLLAGYSPSVLIRSKNIPLVLARNKYGRPTIVQLREALNDSTSFLIVRHPLERLLSAYRDKIQFALPFTLHQKLGTQIILKYRPGAAKGKPNNPRWPTFEEFVRYLIDTHHANRKFDMHWVQITKFCTPCMLRFDVIVNFDTLQEDQLYLIRRSKLDRILKPEWKNPGKGKNTKDLVAGYYSQLTVDQIRQLYHIYRYDFELFNYTLDGYLDFAKPAQGGNNLVSQ